jgi:hypothetical protein
MALLQSGTDITVIRDYLGHASVGTTGRYITTNLQMKRDAMETFWRHSGIGPANAALDRSGKLRAGRIILSRILSGVVVAIGNARR